MFNDQYGQLKEAVENRLAEFLPQVEPGSRLLYDAMVYSLNAGGKRIRPVLLLASCMAAGGRMEEAMPFACALEFIHTYSLIHDDHPSMDNDDLRRGKPTNHKVFGDDMAILAGDGLLNSAMDLMLGKIEEAALSPDSEKNLLLRRIQAAREISGAAGVRGMIAGQTADIRPDGIDADDQSRLIYIHKNKTGALIRAAVRAGALLGGAEGAVLEAFTVYGEQIGIAFQIVDDMLDVTGNAENLGKNTGMDEQMGKLTYPAVYGLTGSRKKAEEATDRARSAMAQPAAANAGASAETEEALVYSVFLDHIALDLLNRIS